MKVSRLRRNAPYYSVKDFDKRMGGTFMVFIVPFKGNNNEKFYYVRELSKSKFEIEGEGYIITNDDSLKKHKKEAREDIGDCEVLYYWVDEN